MPPSQGEHSQALAYLAASLLLSNANVADTHWDVRRDLPIIPSTLVSLRVAPLVCPEDILGSWVACFPLVKVILLMCMCTAGTCWSSGRHVYAPGPQWQAITGSPLGTPTPRAARQVVTLPVEGAAHEGRCLHHAWLNADSISAEKRSRHVPSRAMHKLAGWMLPFCKGDLEGCFPLVVAPYFDLLSMMLCTLGLW